MNLVFSEVEHRGEYFIVKQAASPELCALLTDYLQLKSRVRPNQKRSGDALPQVHREYADTLMETLLMQLTPQVEQVIGAALWPTLSFYYVYRHGNQLHEHTDRSSCQWVAGLCVGADEAFIQREGTWPLMLRHGDGAAESLALACGDLVIFKGHTTPHWRDQFTGEWFISAIFGFVEQAGPFAFQKYDQRQALGRPHVGMFHWAWGCFKHAMWQRIR